jgi:hypothetical protein
MKKCIIPILAAFVLMSCSLPFSIQWNTPTPIVVPATPENPQVVIITATLEPEQPTPTATSAPQFTGVPFSQDGLSMVLPECFATGASLEVVPESNPGADAAYFQYNPQYRKVAFSGYPLSGKFWQPQMLVYPIARYVELVPDLAPRISAMQQDLTNKPAEYTDKIPFLPMENAAQVFHAQVNYVNFQNGQGIGFLTEYAQYYAPANNYDLFYTYQGITGDGKYWVTLIVPVNAAYLQPTYNDPTIPADGIAMPDMMDPNAENLFKAYYQAMVQKMNGTPADSFTPSITCINQFVQSLAVGD